MKFVQINDREFVNLAQVTKVEAHRNTVAAATAPSGAAEGTAPSLIVVLHYNDHGAHRAAQIRGAHAEAVLSHVQGESI
jgi:hypothetical protein